LKYNKQIFFTLISLIIVDSFRWLSYAGFLNLDSSTYIAIFLTYISIYFLLKIALNSDWKTSTPITTQNLLKFWIGLNVLNIVRGFFLAKDYWDYKFIFFNAVTFSLISLVFFIGNNLQKAVIVFKFAFKYLFPFGFLLIPLTLTTNEELYSRIMIPVSLFILFIPFVKWKWKLLIVLVAIVSVSIVLGFRTNIIKITFSVMLLALFYLRGFLNLRILKLLHLFTFLVPIILLVLAIWGNYNFFVEFSENSSGYTVEDKDGKSEDLASDSRTFLYVDIFSTLTRTGHLLIGEGAAGKYDTVLFDYLGDGRGRYSSEVGILNILLYNGLIGVIIYTLLLFTISRIAITQSNNMLCKLIGLFIAFRWLISFIEEFTDFDLNFYFFWIALGLVSNYTFRKLTDKEIKLFFQSI
jgi:hypothetical protein